MLSVGAVKVDGGVDVVEVVVGNGGGVEGVDVSDEVDVVLVDRQVGEDDGRLWSGCGGPRARIEEWKNEREMGRGWSGRVGLALAILCDTCKARNTSRRMVNDSVVRCKMQGN